MWMLAAVSLLFSGWMGWVIYSSLREELPHGLRDWFLTACICCGIASTIATSVWALL
jgi:hypothetical protein